MDVTPMERDTSDPFLAEYSSDDAVQRYTKRTAGFGINYLLEHEYGDVYRRALREHLCAPCLGGIRLLEFGCGGGMNLIHLASVLEREKIAVDTVYGTDFSERLIKSANIEKATYLTREQGQKVVFALARNECLVSDLSAALNVHKAKLLGSFHMLIGVNTFRYCHRLGKEKECARDIFELLMPGGICVMIDMNRQSPFFRSLLRDRLTKPERERYIPSLEEYAVPFYAAGFRIVEQLNFCWIPHSAGPLLLRFCRTATPGLNHFVPSFALRSLIIAQKPL